MCIRDSVLLNKYDNPNGVLVKEGESISESGIYFIAEGATAYWTEMCIRDRQYNKIQPTILIYLTMHY